MCRNIECNFAKVIRRGLIQRSKRIGVDHVYRNRSMRQTISNDREHMFLQRRVRNILQTKLLVVLNESFHEGLEVFRNRGTTQFYSVSIETH